MLIIISSFLLLIANYWLLFEHVYVTQWCWNPFLNHFNPMFDFYTPLKTSENQRFLFGALGITNTQTTKLWRLVTIQEVKNNRNS